MKKILITLVFVFLLIFAASVTIYAAGTPNFGTNKYVEQETEFRATWVSTVSNIDTKTQKGTTPEAIQTWKNQYLTILENAKKDNLNAIIFQIRPCNDAFYPSKYNPWSEYMAGFGVDPGWDPLAWMIEVTHQAGLEYHAWLNPYRASTATLASSITEADQATKATYIYDYDETEINNYKDQYFNHLKSVLQTNDTVVDNPIMKTGDDLHYSILYGTEGKFILNPASEETIEHLEKTVTEIVENYNVDGIHFDDYFYPDDRSYKGKNTNYKSIQYFSCEPNVDYADYQKYVNDQNREGEALSIYDWRRENVNQLIYRLSQIIDKNNLKKTNHFTAFGISPAARYAPDESCPIRGTSNGMKGEGCNNYYSYSDLYADIYKWIKSDWIDYVVPQLYTNLAFDGSGFPTGSYATLVSWWTKTCKGTNCKCYIGTAAYKIQDWITAKTGSQLELYYQIRWNQKCNYPVNGYVFFTYKNIAEGGGQSYSAMSTVVKALWKNFALTPTYNGNNYQTLQESPNVSKIQVNADGSYTINYDLLDQEKCKAYAIFQGETLISRVPNYVSSIDVVKGEELNDYTLVAYGYDNKTSTPVNIDFNQAKENEKPVITFEGEIKKYYKVGEKVQGVFKITDPDSQEFTYELLINGFEVNVGKVVDNQVTLDYKVLDLKKDSYSFTLKVNDGYGDVSFETSSYQIGEEPIVDPIIDPVEPVETGCKKASIIFELMLIVTIMSFVYYKKK